MHQFGRCSLILIWLLLLYHRSSTAQFNSLKFVTYTTNNGLLHNFTKKCIEDNKGFIWIVTEVGISRFDGVNFINFQHDENDPTSLPHNSVNDITTDPSGRIWLATEKGLCYYDPKKGGFTSIDIGGTYTHSPAVLALCTDIRDQSMWFITDKALYKYNFRSRQVSPTTCKNITPTQINQLYLDSDHKLWIACYRSGFLLYDIDHDETSAHLQNGWVTCFFEGKDHTMWIGNWHSEQLVAWNMLTGTYKSWREKDKYGADKYMIISGIISSPLQGDSTILLSTQTTGIRIFNTHLQKFTGSFNRDVFIKYSLPTDFTNNIYSDSRGIVWVCTWNGLSKMNAMEQQFRTIEIPILNSPTFQYYNLVEGIVAADQPGTWWLGINGCGLIDYDPEKKQMIQALYSPIDEGKGSIPSGAWTEFLINTEDGETWAGNEIGIAKINGKKVIQYDITVDHVHPWKKSICVAADHSFWISTSTHLVHFDHKSGNYKTYEIDSSLHQPLPIRSVTESGFCGDSILWVGTIKGLFRFNVNTFSSERIALKETGTDSLEVNTINSLLTDGNETVYLGTLAGLGIYNVRTRQFKLKGKIEQVNPILWKSMLRDKTGNVWIYTPHSLFKYDPSRDEFTRFTTANGIYNFSSDQTHLFSFNDNFYIGYRGAYTEFDPLKVDINQTYVKPLITELLIGSKVQKMDIDSFSNHILSLTPDKKEITFHFTGIDYTNSDKITFTYNLDPDTAWHESGTNRAVTYTHLAPGNYTFRLKARNSSGIINDEAAVFNLYVAPSLLQHWWFWPLMVMGFTSAVIFFANRRVKKIREEEKLKTETNKMLAQLETKLLRSQMNPHFIFNSLNSIQKYIWENKEEDAAEYLARFAKLIRAILENSRKEFISLQEELEVLKLYIDLEHRRSNGKFDYHILVEEDIHPDQIIIPPLLIQPYIENAIWHGVNKKQGHGHIDINVKKEIDLLIIIIEDDGVGRAFNYAQRSQTSTEKTSMGTNITQQRIDLLETQGTRGSVSIIDKQNMNGPSGTAVIIAIPFKMLTHA